MAAHFFDVELELLKTGLCSEEMQGILSARVSDLIQNHALIVFQHNSVAVHEVG